MAGLTSREKDIIRRIVLLRTRCYGRRGRALFSKALGIKPSTYHPYEINRVPPAETLLRMAEVTGTDVRWLLTGEEQSSGLNAPTFDPLLSRVNRVIQTYPGSAQGLQSFLELLERTFAQSARSRVRPENNTPAERTVYVPVVGRSAVGLPASWSWPQADTWSATLGGQLSGPEHASRVGTVDLADFMGQSKNAALRFGEVPVPDGLSVGGVPAIDLYAVDDVPEEWSPVIGLRMDGQTMAPAYEHGDILLLTPKNPLQAGAIGPAGVVAALKFKHEPGVQVRLVTAESSGQLRLIALDAAVPAVVVSANELEWAQVVLGRLRLPR